MKKLMKKSVVLLVGAIALAGVAGLAQAETRFAVQDAGGTVDKMVVTDGGFIGIGTNLPGAAIEISGAPGNVASRMLMKTSGVKSNAGGGGVISLHNNDLATNSSFPIKNDRLGFYLFGTKNGTANTTSAGIEAFAADNWTPPSILPSYLRFVTGGAIRLLIDTNGNTGFGTTAPTQKIEVNGAIRLNTSVAKPVTCDSTLRGVLYFNQGGTGTADSLEVCAKDVSGNYSWNKLY